MFILNSDNVSLTCHQRFEQFYHNLACHQPTPTCLGLKGYVVVVVDDVSDLGS